MKDKIYNEVFKKITARRMSAENIAYKNKTSAMNDQNFKDIYLKYIDKLINNSRQGILNDNQLVLLENQYKERLVELKLGNIEPDYTCKNCNDTGFAQGRYCNCFIEELNHSLIKESGFYSLEDFNTTSFELFDNSYLMKNLYQKMQKWCHSNFDKSLIFLSGQTGVGKTHLMKCMANELIKEHKIVLLTTSFAMHQDFVKSFACRDGEEKQQIIEKYIDTEVLFIDDLGTEPVLKNVTKEYLYNLINVRQVKGKPTFITSNLSLENILDRYDERIFSRLGNKNLSINIVLNSQDKRLK